MNGERKRMKKVLSVFLASLTILLMILIPSFAVNGPLTQQLQYKFYQGQEALFTGLLSGDIDFMAWPLTYTQYMTAITTTNITVAPYFDLGDCEIAFNNWATDPSHMADRKAMNYTEFRQAMACLVDKDGLIAGPTVNGFATRIDTSMARPSLDPWVNFDDAKYASDGTLLNNYPWDYNETHALEILWNNGWYSHTTYPTLSALLTAFAGGPLPAGSVVYPTGHLRAGATIDAIKAYIRSDHLPRKQAGENLVAEMTKIGIGTSVTLGASSVCYTPVFINHDYDFYTAGWSFGRFPLHFYSMNTPVGIYPGGSNLYMIDDANMTLHATLEYPNATSGAQSLAEAKICQDIMVKNAFYVTLYSSASYMGYRTGVVGAINFRGYGLTTALEYTFLNAKTAPYSSPMTIKYGTLNPPEQINPIFSSGVQDYEVADRIFNGLMATNPYKPTVPGKSPAGADQPWMADDWNFQQSTFTGGGGQGDPDTTYTNMANVTFWFRHDITWQDGVPFTVDDFNFTIFLQKSYGDSWGYSDMIHVVNFVKIDAWTCSVYFDIPTFWALYTADYDQVPMHIYKYIAIPAGAGDGTSTTGHHGYWPGAAAEPSEILPGAPFTFSQLTGAGGEQYTWTGTGMWMYSPGTLVQGTGGGLVCIPYSGFWMSSVPGEIDFKYSWNAGPAPQGGSYMVGLSDMILLGNAYGTSGNGHAVPFKLGGLHVWEPGCDIAPPAGVVGLSDWVTLGLNFGKHWGSGLGGGVGGGGDSGGSGALISVTPELVELGPADSVGQNFTVAVVVQNVTQTNVPAGLSGVEVHLAWDATLLQPLSYVDKLGVSGGVLAGSLLRISPGFFDDAGNSITTPPYTGATNYKVAAASFTSPWWGNGTVAEITFQAIHQPSTPPPASCTLELGYAELVDRGGNGIGFQRQNGQYIIQPTTPYFCIEPQNVTMGPKNAINKTFPVAIRIHNMTVDKAPNGLEGVEVIVRWNTSLLQPAGFTDRLGTSGGVLNTPLLYGREAGFYGDSFNRLSPPYTGATMFVVAAVSTGNAWWGDNGTVAELSFKVIYQPNVPQSAVGCPIEFALTDMVDANYNTISHFHVDGYCEILPHLAGVPDLYVAPSEAQMTHGVNFNVDIGVLNVTDLYAYDIILRFDPSLLQVYNVTEGSFLKSGGTTQVFLNEVNQTEGSLRYVVTLLSAPTGVNGSGTLFTVTFTSDLVNNGTSVLSFQNGTELSDSHVNLIQPYDTEEGSITVVDVAQATCNVMVGETEYTILMVSNSSVPVGEQLLYNDSNKAVTFNLTGPSGYPGFCNVTIPKQVMNGTYAVLVNGTAIAYTQTENATHYILNFTYSQGFNQIKVLLTIPGDINGDRKVSLSDLVLLANAYGSTPGSPKWDACCDVYRDNRISLQDLVVLALNYSKTYP